ncbi:MAG: hypothetical protein MJY77_02130 [Bacteroidaceae bacterium]|nr:hypothetical protein [Bacteroidaceae bacterium]
MRRLVIILAVGVLLTVSAQAQSLSKQYCNPLPMEIGPYRYAGNNPLLRKIVKLTVTGWTENAPRGIIDFTVFGYPSGEKPAAVASPVFSNLPPDKFM